MREEALSVVKSAGKNENLPAEGLQLYVGGNIVPVLLIK